MFRYNKAALVLLSLLFTGCAGLFAPQPIVVKSVPVETNTSLYTESLEYVEMKNSIDSNKTDEDAYLMCAVWALDEKNLLLAKECFEAYYDYNKSSDTLKELVRLNTYLGLDSKNEKLLLEGEKLDSQDLDIKRLLVTHYIQMKQFDEAVRLAEQLANTSKAAQDYEMAANIYLYQSDTKNALLHLKAAYKAKPGDKAVDALATLLFVGFDKKNEAIALYESHIRMYGCSRYICDRLMTAYHDVGNIKRMTEISKKMYFKFKDKKLAKKTIELYLSTNDVEALIEFLEKTGADDKTLLDAYKYKKAHKKASKLAMKLYKSTGEYDYLALNAIFAFESVDHKSQALIKETVEKLSTAVEHIQNDIYDNYLGFMLIDYDIDLQKGMMLVKRALEKNPDSPYYIDSLAWGYYKQKNCTEASKLMQHKALSELKNDEQLQEHKKIIEKCLKKNRK